MERSRSSKDIIGILQSGINELSSDVTKIKGRDLSIPDWITLVLGSNWVAYDVVNPSLQYWRDYSGIVRLRGIIKGGTFNPNIVTTLPEGFRPSALQRFAVVSNGAFGWVQVATTGDIIVVAGSNLWVDFSSVSFRAEQ